MRVTWSRAVALIVVLASGPAVFAQGAAAPVVAQAQGGTAEQAAAIRVEVERLRQEFQALRQQYDERLKALEGRLEVLESGRAGQAAVPPATPPQATIPAQAPPGEAAPVATPPPGGLLSKIFNPDIAVVGDFVGAAGRNAVEPGPAFDLQEAEVSYQAVVDPYARADFFFAFGGEGVEIEEGYLSLTHLPGGLLGRVGQMRSAFGRVGLMHTHVLPWVDRPLVVRSLAGGEDGIKDAGVSVARLVPNPWLFVEATGQVFRGSSEVFQAWKRSDLTYVGHVRGYRDLTESSNLDLGGSIAYGTNDVAPGFKTRLYGFDATVRYRPLQRAIYRQFIGRSELVWSRRDQDGGRARSFGFFVSGDYQLGRRWFAGARYDWSDRPDDPTLTDKGTALLVTFRPSEFSTVRGQWRRTRYAEGRTANEALVQFLFSIGTHGAHPF